LRICWHFYFKQKALAEKSLGQGQDKGPSNDAVFHPDYQLPTIPLRTIAN